MSRIYPEKGFTPTQIEYQALAAAFIPFGKVTYVGREKGKNGYIKFVEARSPSELGATIKAPADGTNIDEGTDK